MNKQKEAIKLMKSIPVTGAFDKYQIASRVKIAGFDGWTGRMMAELQRELFGVKVFGQKKITIDCNNQGRVYGSFSVCFGHDYTKFEKYFDELASINSGDRAICF